MLTLEDKVGTGRKVYKNSETTEIMPGKQVVQDGSATEADGGK